MSRSYPENIPAAFASNEYLSDAYRKGWNHGQGIACHNVPTLGDKLWVESIGRVTVDAENIREVHEALCFEAAENSRSYSPFEFTAAEFNAAREGGWFILEYGEAPRGPFESREEAENEADGGEYEIVEMPSADELWEAFEEGAADAIRADLSEYDYEDYGIEDEE